MKIIKILMIVCMFLCLFWLVLSIVDRNFIQFFLAFVSGWLWIIAYDLIGLALDEDDVYYDSKN